MGLKRLMSSSEPCEPNCLDKGSCLREQQAPASGKSKVDISWGKEQEPEAPGRCKEGNIAMRGGKKNRLKSTSEWCMLNGFASTAYYRLRSWPCIVPHVNGTDATLRL
jgi:hypothetical protein